MTIGQVGMKHPSLSAMIQAINACISREALHQRFTECASEYLYKCLQYVIRQEINYSSISTDILDTFNRVLIIDSSTWSIAEKLKNVFKGRGGYASAAACKIQAVFDYKKSEISLLEATSGTLPDGRYTNKIADLMRKNDLILPDLGYFKVSTFNKIAAKGAFYLSRYHIGTSLLDADTMERIDLEERLGQCQSLSTEMQVVMERGDHKFESRLICLRATEEIGNKRRMELKKRAKKRGYKPREFRLRLCDWSIMITNIPEKDLPLEMVRALYTLRWQIELIFKDFKSILQIHKVATGNEHRLRCELYGKLIAAIMIHHIHGASNSELWNSSRREISIDKLYKRIQERSFHLSQLLMTSFRKAIIYLKQELKVVLKHCLKKHQRSRMTSLEMLEAGYDPRLKRDYMS